ncbi:MAG: hypothetical protein IJS47_06305 [Clostridia bacterium]|nr:hypothetical protein [Clostridia bacterium]
MIFRIYCALMWILSSILFLYLSFKVSSSATTLQDKIIIFFTLAFGIAGLIIGIYILAFEIKKIIRHLITAKKGEECYGRLVDNHITGARVNGKAELKGYFAIFMPSDNQVKIFSQIIGTNLKKFPAGSYWKLKYYDGEINILKQIDSSEVPYVILETIETNSTVEYSSFSSERYER